MINKPHQPVNYSQPKLLRYIAATVLSLVCAGIFGCGQNADNVPARHITISNIEPRLDSNGNIIDAHDGCIEQFAGKFYLYGTAYGSTDGFTVANHYVCYSSPDLVKWTFHGDILSNAPVGVYYRPYVKYNRKTNKYVLWYNWYSKLWEGQYGVATADSPEGPFIIQNTNVEVKQPKPGDHGLFVDDDGTGYLIYTSIEKDHGISVEKLNEDYLSSTLKNSDIIAKGCEAPSLIKKAGLYYAFFDNCCCFCAEGSGARIYTAGSPMGPFILKGNINRSEDGKVIIPAQQTHIAEIRTKSGIEYIWMGDLWKSSPDGIKGHDFQYWSSPLKFDANKVIERLQWQDSYSIDLPVSQK